MLLDSCGEFSYVLMILRLWSDLEFIGFLIVSPGTNKLDLVFLISNKKQIRFSYRELSFPR